jgi:hypothetical protein
MALTGGPIAAGGHNLNVVAEAAISCCKILAVQIKRKVEEMNSYFPGEGYACEMIVRKEDC